MKRYFPWEQKFVGFCNEGNFQKHLEIKLTFFEPFFKMEKLASAKLRPSNRKTHRFAWTQKTR